MNPLHKADNEPDATSMGASMRPGSAAASPAIPQAGTEEHTRRQIIWDKKMQNSTESRRHYEKTAVLLVAFEDTDLKDLDKEVRSTLFSRAEFLLTSYRSTALVKFSKIHTDSMSTKG
jgi:hypothetical protein